MKTSLTTYTDIQNRMNKLNGKNRLNEVKYSASIQVSKQEIEQYINNHLKKIKARIKKLEKNIEIENKIESLKEEIAEVKTSPFYVKNNSKLLKLPPKQQRFHNKIAKLQSKIDNHKKAYQQVQKTRVQELLYINPTALQDAYDINDYVEDEQFADVDGLLTKYHAYVKKAMPIVKGEVLNIMRLQITGTRKRLII